MDYVYLTKKGFDSLKKELNDLKFNIRPGISAKVAAAREHGDLKENAEYHAAREELSLTETKIQQLQDRLARARVIDEKEISKDVVSILNTVLVQDMKNNKEYKYILVSAEEADIRQDKISIASPVGRGLLGKKVGDLTEIEVPAGKLKYKILSIE
ncbi:MAG: transcription elongation factor GreA [Calditrichaceae bacterium]|nr:transcription elongation factor GreA [Calditrichaceae bacterium]MBN2709919.1 transcription elongation factor GreA [Calditrichaceae bacterium]RQV92671.1 MAG: transcription elongation factor GreA [Calditrichota bacterium]